MLFFLGGSGGGGGGVGVVLFYKASATITILNAILFFKFEQVHTWLSYSVLIGLKFNGPVNTIKIMLSRSVYLTTLFLGRFSPLSH